MRAEIISSDTSSSSFSSWKYDVFLSFRGEDTRKNFVDHLYAALNHRGIYVFRDDKELERGKIISPELFKAIEESRCSIVVFSKNYASSTWCLDELVKIVECMKTMGQRIVPIFYHVDPSVIRKQKGTFEIAFAKHENVFKENMERVQSWRTALIEVANISGWHAQDRHETEFIEDIIRDIERKLNQKISVTFEDLVGINSRKEELRLLINTGSIDIRMIGICGMGGIGKTTIARVVFESIYHQFEGSVFLANVREISGKDGLVSLQRQLLSKALRGKNKKIYDVYDGKCKLQRRLQHKKVLIVVDDVDHKKQLDALVGKHEWFGLGSRIIITTRDKHLLKTHRVDKVYEAKELNHDESLQLLISKAFKNHQPSKDYMGLCKRVVKYTGGLPLALEVLGSFLFGKTMKEWEDGLQRLNKDFEKGIFEILWVSFDGLEKTEQEIFLDIACFFKGENKEYVTRILGGCGLYPIIGIKVLVDKSLITISKCNTLWMHDLVQEMGKQIVKKQSPNEPGMRNRLWEKANVYHVLTRNMGSEVVEGIMLNFLEEQVHCSPEAFSKMRNLRLLKIRNVQLPNGLEYLSDELRLLDWADYPLKSLPDDMKLDKVVELKLNGSHIRKISNKTKAFNTLTSISLKNCRYLKRTLDFAGAPNVEKVILERCKRLHKIHPSLLLHKKITHLNLKGCTRLATLPNKIHMESLEKLQLSCCSKLKYFPEIVGSMNRLSVIFLGGTAIKELPMSMGFLNGLQQLSLINSRNLVSLPLSINGMKSLQRLDLQECSRLESLPYTLGQLENLRWLYVTGTAVRQSMSSTVALRLPSLSGLFAPLIELSLNNSNLDEEAFSSDFFKSFSSLKRLDLSNNNFVSLPKSMNCLSKLESLKVNSCTSLKTFSNASRLCNLKLSEISCANCFKLMGNNNMPISMLKEHLNKEVLKLRDKFGFFKLLRRIKGKVSLVVPGSEIAECYSYGAVNKLRKKYRFFDQLFQFQDEFFHTFKMVAPGSEIPEWFDHKSECFNCLRTKIKRPPYGKLVGCLVCSVIDFNNAHQKDKKDSCEFSCVTRNICLAKAEIKMDKNASEVMSEHLVLIFFPPEVPDRCHLEYGEHDDGSWFSLEMRGKGKVKKWGVHMVYEEDVKEFNKIKSHSTWWNWKPFHEDDDVGSRKRRSCYDEGPERKRSKLLDFFSKG